MALKTTAPKPPRVAKPKGAPKAVKAATDIIEDQAADAGADHAVPAKAGGKAGALKLKDVIDRVTDSSGIKKKDVKTVVEAVMALLGTALARGEAMSLPGLGHLRVARQASAASPVMTIKLRPMDGGKGKGKSDVADEKDTLAEDSDQG